MIHHTKQSVLGFLVFILTLLLAACKHVVKRPSECAPPPGPIGESGLGWQRAPGSGVNGKVLAPGTLAPIQSVTVTLTQLSASPQIAPTTLQRITDAHGEFQFEATPPAQYLMRVRRLGYRQAHDTIQVTSDSGIVATGLLVPGNIMFDECSLTYQEVRVPWWKR